MYLTGFHGTSLEFAHKIIKEDRFILSTSSTEWLGPGIYFYSDIDDALRWNTSDAVLFALIKCTEREFFDCDTKEGRSTLREIRDHICSTMGEDYFGGNIEENQCALMKMAWDTNPHIKVMAATFPTEKTSVKLMVDLRPTRREFAVRDNKSIIYKHLIRKDEIE